MIGNFVHNTDNAMRGNNAHSRFDPFRTSGIDNEIIIGKVQGGTDNPSAQAYVTLGIEGIRQERIRSMTKRKQGTFYLCSQPSIFFLQFQIFRLKFILATHIPANRYKIPLDCRAKFIQLR